MVLSFYSSFSWLFRVPFNGSTWVSGFLGLNFGSPISLFGVASGLRSLGSVAALNLFSMSHDFPLGCYFASDVTKLGLVCFASVSGTTDLRRLGLDRFKAQGMILTICRVSGATLRRVWFDSVRGVWWKN